MLPSDYVRLGIAIRPRQVTHILVDNDNASCVMGAMMEGHAGRKLSYLEAQNYYITLEGEMKWLYDRVACPVCGEYRSVVNTAVNLNNEHGWSREKIGDWMDQFAPQEQSPESQKRDAGSQETPDARKRDAGARKTPVVAEREEVCA